MKLAMLRPRVGEPGKPAVILNEGRAVWFRDVLGEEGPRSIDALVQGDWPYWLSQLRQHLGSRDDFALTGSDLISAAPISFRRNVLCVGRNYREHAQEAVRSGLATAVNQESPIFFTKATTTLNYHQGPVVAFDCTTALDYEAELGVVIGKAGRGVAASQAEDYIFGYTLLNDLTARDVQQQHQQWFLGKSFDGYCPIGPMVVTRDEIDWPVRLNIVMTVNGEERQNFNTQDMIFDIGGQVEWLSKAMTLLPGDVIATGTGDGVGRSFQPPRYLKPGDRMDIACAPLGQLSNIVVAPGA